ERGAGLWGGPNLPLHVEAQVGEAPVPESGGSGAGLARSPDRGTREEDRCHVLSSPGSPTKLESQGGDVAVQLQACSSNRDRASIVAGLITAGPQPTFAGPSDKAAV